jgi:hypothetical protein
LRNGVDRGSLSATWQGRLTPTLTGLTALIHRLQVMCRGYAAQIAPLADQTGACGLDRA